MVLRDCLHVVRRRWIHLVVFLALGVGGAYAAYAATPPTYSATTQVFVSARTEGTANDLQLGGAFAQARIQSYTDLVTSPSVLNPVARKFGLGDGHALDGRVTASAAADTVLINITVTDRSARRAAGLSDAVAAQLSTAVDDLERPDARAESPVRISTVREARVPASPDSPVWSQYLGLGLVGGLLAGVVAVAVRESLDPRIRDLRTLAATTDRPALALVPRRYRASRRYRDPRTTGQWGEAFRRLQIALTDGPQGTPGTVLLTAASPGEGTTTVATWFALAQAERDRRTLLVEVDPRDPVLARRLGLDATPGLAGVLAGEADLEAAVRAWGTTGVDVLAAGTGPAGPRWLTAEGLGAVLTEAGERYDSVVVAAPPILSVSDTALLARRASATVLVVRLDRARRGFVVQALEQLRQAGVEPVGLVVNGATRSTADIPRDRPTWPRPGAGAPPRGPAPSPVGPAVRDDAPADDAVTTRRTDDAVTTAH